MGASSPHYQSSQMKSSGKRIPAEKKSSSKKNLPEWYDVVIIFLISFILYGNTLTHQYALDDYAIIVNNHFTAKGFGGIADHLTSSYWEGIGKNVRSYRPLSPVTFALETGIAGMNPHVGHLVNILLTFLTGIALFRLLRRLFRLSGMTVTDIVPLMGTLLFLAHPLHTEVVANLKSRDTILELLFLILAANLLMSDIESASPRKRWVSALCFFFALLSKESAISFLVMAGVVLLLFDRRPLMKKLLTWMVFLVPVAIFLLLFFRYSDFQAFTSLHLLDNMLIADKPASTIQATKFLILFKYLILLLYPHPLLYDYSYQQLPYTGFDDPKVILALVIYATLTIFAIWILWKRIRGMKTGSLQILGAFSIAWFLMGFFASSNLVLTIGSTMAERFMYSPSLGFIIMLVLILNIAFQPKRNNNGSHSGPPAAFYLVTLLILLVYSAKTIHRNRAWKDNLTLYTNDLPWQENNVKAHDFLANEYTAMADTTKDPQRKTELYLQAIKLKEKALSIYPALPEIVQNLGFLYGNVGDFPKAVAYYRQAIGMNPGDITNYIQLGKALGMTEQRRDAIGVLLEAEKIDPDNAEIQTLLGIMYARENDFTRALPHFDKACRLNPEDAQCRELLEITRQQAEKSLQ